MPDFLKFSMVFWSVDKDGKRYPDVHPIFFRLATPIKDFRTPAPGFTQGYWWNVQLRWSTLVLDQLSSQATPLGPMAELSDKPPGKGYASRKRAQFGEQPILIATGTMFDGYFGGSDHVFEEGAMGVKFGNRNPLAGYHFRGHKTPTPLPRRPLGMPDEDLGSAIQSDAVRYLAARYRIEGFRVAREAGTPLNRLQASQVGKMVLGGGYGPLAPPATEIGQSAMPL